MFIRHTLVSFCLLIATLSWAQPAYKLDFKISGLKDTTVYLGYYYGESTFVKDTARINSKGEFTFDENSPTATSSHTP